MSKIGKQPINIPDSVKISLAKDIITIVGPKGELTSPIPGQIKVSIDQGQLKFVSMQTSPRTRALHGLTRALVANAVIGVTDGFTKRLELKGVGYKAELINNQLVLNLGFSHPITIIVPQDLEVKVEKNQIVVHGIDKQKVGQFCAIVRSARPPEPYKGKGIRYVGEIIKIKPGKQIAKTTA